MTSPTEAIVDVEPIERLEVTTHSSVEPEYLDVTPPPRGTVVWAGSGMRAQLVTDIAVVRSTKPSRCEQCHHRRVLFALTLTAALLGNPERPWRCAPCWGLRP